MKANECKCCVCGKQAVAYYPCVDPDIPSHPYCADHLEEAMIDMAKAVWKDNKGMQAMAIQMAKIAAEKYRKEVQL